MFMIFFNPRLREGGDYLSIFCVSLHNFFSIHASAKEATPFGWSNGNSSFFFNPRLREGGDAVNASDDNMLKFSIHASAKEATKRTYSERYMPSFSIHASAKEATVFMFTAHFVTFFFNPRLREGGDNLNGTCITQI